MFALWRTIGGSVIDEEFGAALAAHADGIFPLQHFLAVQQVKGSTPLKVLAPLQRIYSHKAEDIAQPLAALRASVNAEKPNTTFASWQDACAVLGLAVCSEIFAERLHQHSTDLATFRYFVRNNPLQAFEFDDAQIDLLFPFFRKDGFTQLLRDFMVVAWRHPAKAKTWALCDGAVPSELHTKLTEEGNLHEVDSKLLITVALDPAGVGVIADGLLARDSSSQDYPDRERALAEAKKIQALLRTTLTETLDVLSAVPLGRRVCGEVLVADGSQASPASELVPELGD